MDGYQTVRGHGQIQALFRVPQVGQELLALLVNQDGQVVQDGQVLLVNQDGQVLLVNQVGQVLSVNQVGQVRMVILGELPLSSIIV